MENTVAQGPKGVAIACAAETSIMLMPFYKRIPAAAEIWVRKESEHTGGSQSRDFGSAASAAGPRRTEQVGAGIGGLTLSFGCLCCCGWLDVVSILEG